MMRIDIVDSVLDIDKEHSYEGVEDDIFENHKIVRTVYNGYHTMIYQEEEGPELIRESAEVLAELKKDKFLKNFPWSHVLLAGGYISSKIIGETSKDMDMFIYGIPTTNELDKKVEKIIKYVDTFFSNCTVLRTDYTIKILCEPYIEIILRAYKTKSEILHSFDLGSSAVGYDGKNIYFTTLSKFAYDYGCNIISVARASQTYDNRLLKYYKRGFNIIFPNLYLEKIPSELRIHYMIFKNICGPEEEKNRYCCLDVECPEAKKSYDKCIDVHTLLSKKEKGNFILFNTDILSGGSDEIEKIRKTLKESILLSGFNDFIDKYIKACKENLKRAIEDSNKRRTNWRFFSEYGLSAQFFPLKITLEEFYKDATTKPKHKISETSSDGESYQDQVCDDGDEECFIDDDL